MNTLEKGYHGKLSTLLQWNKADPVDSFEINRNNVVYKYQKRRNPFIDHPEYVGAIWNTTGIQLQQQEEIKIYPNPARDFVIIELPNDETAQCKLISIKGVTVLNF